jgi:8-oxo-dGTP diphosphatase
MIDVTCAIIRNDENQILAVQRGEVSDHPFKWEFPGGKINKGETPEECIIREILEELSMDIVICSSLSPVEYDYGHKKIRLLPFVCDTLDELPLLSEHIGFRWLPAGELKTIDFCGADMVVAREYLKTGGEKIDPEAQSCPAALSFDEDTGLQQMVEMMKSAKEAEWIAGSATGNPEIFRKLLGYSLSQDRKLASHSSWILTKACDNQPDMIYPYLPEIIGSLDKLENESSKRSLLRIISLSDVNKISKLYHGMLADHCFTLLRSGFSAIALKAYSMEILYRLALIYPEMTNELSVSINMLRGEGSAGILARGRIILNKLSR